jgi:hypothetical protein
MTRSEYEEKHPPPTDPRELKAYRVAFFAMTIGLRPWGPPPVLNSEREKYGQRSGASDAEIKARKTAPRTYKSIVDGTHERGNPTRADFGENDDDDLLD